jgi:hypothetical protein
MVTSVRSGVHVLVVLASMKRAEEVAREIFKVRVDKVIYLHDGATAYNAFTWLNVEHEKVTFNERDYAEQGFRSLRHLHQRTSTSLGILTITITRWLSTFFLIYPLHPNVLGR